MAERGRQRPQASVKTPAPPLQVWHVEDAAGAFFVLAVFAFLGVTLWIGWPAVSSWIWARF
jgi:hypothetical protein